MSSGEGAEPVAASPEDPPRSASPPGEPSGELVRRDTGRGGRESLPARPGLQLLPISSVLAVVGLAAAGLGQPAADHVPDGEQGDVQPRLVGAEPVGDRAVVADRLRRDEREDDGEDVDDLFPEARMDRREHRLLSGHRSGPRVSELSQWRRTGADQTCAVVRAAGRRGLARPVCGGDLYRPGEPAGPRPGRGSSTWPVPTERCGGGPAVAAGSAASDRSNCQSRVWSQGPPSRLAGGGPPHSTTVRAPRLGQGADPGRSGGPAGDRVMDLRLPRRRRVPGQVLLRTAGSGEPGVPGLSPVVVCGVRRER